MRNDTGRYTCVAFNKHGRSTAETFIDVQCKYYKKQKYIKY